MRRVAGWIKLASAVVATLVVASPLILGINTIRHRSKQVRVPPARAFEPRPGFAERLAAILRLPTIADRAASIVDPAPFVALHEQLAESFPLVHARLDREVFGGHSHQFRWSGSDPSRRPILLMSHLDVVPVESGTEGDWTYPPFSGQIAGGYVWGRGAMDVKCGAAGLLEAVESLLASGFRPESDVYLAFGHDEEAGGREGNRRIAGALADRGVRLELVLDEGGGITRGIIGGIPGPVAFIGIAEKGYATMELEAEGDPGHSSMPPPHTAVGRLGAALGRLEASPLPASLDGATGAMLDYLGPEMPWTRRVVLANRWLSGGLIAREFASKPSLNALIRTTVAATVTRGGESEHVLPARASAMINVRLRPGDAPESVKADILGVAGGEGIRCVRWDVLSEASAVSSVESRGFRALQRTIAGCYPGTVVTPGLSMVATDSRHYAPIADDIYRFLPLRVTSEDLERIHGLDERIGVEDYADLIGFLARLIEDLAGPPSAESPADVPRGGGEAPGQGESSSGPR